MHKEQRCERASILALAIFAVGCHRSRVVAPPQQFQPPPPAVPTCTLTAEPAAIQLGQSVTLSWKSENATDIELEPRLGKQQAQGSTSVAPQDSTTYTFIATGPGGTTNCTARVTVATSPSPPPPAPKGPPLEKTFSIEIKDAYFDFDKYDLRADAQQALTANAEFLKAHPAISFTIEGHCDARGSEEYNLGLGDLRATAAKSFLENLGVSANRMSTISYGKTRPVCTENDEDCWWKNRRARLKLQETGER